MDLIKALNKEQLEKEVPQVQVGDTVRVHVKVKEGARERIQVFEGTVIAKKHGGIEETITALTLNGAAALQRADRIGSIEVGKQGDFVILNSDNYHILPYYVGMNCVIMTIKGGMLYPVA